MVQGIARNLCGGIHLSSEPGMGSTFQILLPCIQSQAEGATGTPPQVAQAAEPSVGGTVLVVEDEDSLRQPVAKMLRKTGVDVLEAADGSTAIDLLRANSGGIDAMLLDMTIPGRSTADVVAEASQIRPELKVLLTSAYSQETVMAGIQSPVIRGFIRKPFQLGKLVERVRSVLSS